MNARSFYGANPRQEGSSESDDREFVTLIINHMKHYQKFPRLTHSQQS